MEGGVGNAYTLVKEWLRGAIIDVQNNSFKVYWQISTKTFGHIYTNIHTNKDQDNIFTILQFIQYKITITS
jgi:hypothetical protein